MNLYKLSLLLIISISLINCTTPDKETSLLEPKFQRCYMSKEFVNNQLWKEVIYKEDGSFNIDQVLYYQNNVVRQDWTESFEYKDGKISRKSDSYNSWEYSYNDHGDMASIITCEIPSGSCCTSTYSYNYDLNNLPQKITTTCNGGGGYTETLDYTNLDSRSYYYIYQDANETSLSSYQKFVEQFIDPNADISPDGVNYYLDRIIEDYKAKEFVEKVIAPNDVKGRYPLKVSEFIYSLPNFQQTGQNVYTYEYVGCD